MVTLFTIHSVSAPYRYVSVSNLPPPRFRSGGFLLPPQVTAPHPPRLASNAPLYLPCTSPASPLYLPLASNTSVSTGVELTGYSVSWRRNGDTAARTKLLIEENVLKGSVPDLLGSTEYDFQFTAHNEYGEP